MMGQLEAEAAERLIITRTIRPIVESCGSFRHIGTGWEWWLEMPGAHMLVLRREPLDHQPWICYHRDGLTMRPLAQAADPLRTILAGLRKWAMERDQGKAGQPCKPTT